MAEPVVLALDTASTVSVGVARGGRALGVAHHEDRMAHVEQLMPLLRDLLRDLEVRLVEVSSIVVGLGPGPFTGLRVGVATARVLASVAAVPLHGVCSLDVIAAQHARQATEEFLVATDARRQEVYWARYAADGRRLDAPAVGRPETLPPGPVVGPATLLYPDRLAAVPGPTMLDAGEMAVRGPDLPFAGTEPLYLRRPDAAEPARRKRVLLNRGSGT
ncbi:MAG: tRNA (adenosine(37)-N6)-threonylcarbamoyltransferase complex dimerization subunit type 1 TsaB [Actinomycetes bacterium]